MTDRRIAKITWAAAAIALPLIGALDALAEGDGPYTFNKNQEFDNNYAKYKNNEGLVTNFDKELFPINPFGNDGKLFFRREAVPTTGTGGARLEDGETSLQLQFKF